MPQLGQRPDHPSERQFRHAFSVDEPRTDDRRARQPAEGIDEPIDGAIGHTRVAVQQQHELAVRLPEAGVVRARKAEVRIEREHAARRATGRRNAATLPSLDALSITTIS